MATYVLSNTFLKIQDGGQSFCTVLDFEGFPLFQIFLESFERVGKLIITSKNVRVNKEQLLKRSWKNL